MLETNRLKKEAKLKFNWKFTEMPDDYNKTIVFFAWKKCLNNFSDNFSERNIKNEVIDPRIEFFFTRKVFKKKMESEFFLDFHIFIRDSKSDIFDI